MQDKHPYRPRASITAAFFQAYFHPAFWAADLKGTKSYRTWKNFRPSERMIKRPSVCPDPHGYKNFKLLMQSYVFLGQSTNLKLDCGVAQDE